MSLQYAIEQIVGELDLERLLERIVEGACKLSNREFAQVVLSDPATHIAFPVAHFSTSGQAASIRDSATRSIPLTRNGKTLGALILGGDQNPTIEIVNFAHYAALAIENARLVEENVRSTEQRALLLRTTERIGNAMSVDEVITAYLDQVASNGRYYCSILLYDFDEKGNKVGNLVRGQWAPGGQVELFEIRIPADQDELDPMLAAGQTVTYADVFTEPNIPPSLRAEQERDNRPALALVPLIGDGRRIGLVILSYDRPHNWTREELAPFQATAVQLASALQSRRDHDALIETDRRLAVLDERRRLARELHDSVTQILFSLNLLAQSLEPDAPAPRELVEKIVELSRRGLGDMRSLLEELRPVKGQSGRPTLPQRISAHAATLIGLPPFALNSEPYRPVSEEIEQELFRICQEALNNVAKHARANSASVTLLSDGSKVKLKIQDDGVGMLKKGHQEKRQGFGLTGMHERAEEINATLEVASSPETGTTIEVRWPKDDD